MPCYDDDDDDDDDDEVADVSLELFYFYVGKSDWFNDLNLSQQIVNVNPENLISAIFRMKLLKQVECKPQIGQWLRLISSNSLVAAIFLNMDIT